MNLFIYIRLSSADKDLKFKTESESISNQRALLRRYIDTHSDLSGCVSEEFVDDGYSGTNADRPAFERMIERVKNGEADIIICKDFSRFFRDYVEIGDYLERIFPFLGVRFISVNDNYDSDNYKGTTSGMEVVMKYIVYSSYSRDLSQKVKTVMQAKHKKGQWVGAYAPYGYKKDPNNKNHLVPDPNTAPIVKRIFNLAQSGTKTSDIALALNKDKIPTPSEYFRSLHPDSKRFAGASEQNCWNTANIKRILKTKLYTGAMVSNTRKWKSIDNPRTEKLDESQWIIVPNCHEAIVTDEEFEKAQTAIRKYNRNENTAPRDYPMRSLIICGVCGRAMLRHPQGKRKYYVCDRSLANPDTSCPVKEKFYEKDIEDVVVQDLREKLRLFVDNQKRLREADKSTLGTEANIRANIDRLEKLLKQKAFERKSAYERYVDELIAKDEFLLIKDKLSGEEENLRTEISRLREKLQIIIAQKNDSTIRLADKAEDFLSEQNITNEMLLYFINKVKVYSGNKIEIEYRFKDIFENVLKTK